MKVESVPAEKTSQATTANTTSPSHLFQEMISDMTSLPDEEMKPIDKKIDKTDTKKEDETFLQTDLIDPAYQEMAVLAVTQLMDHQQPEELLVSDLPNTVDSTEQKIKIAVPVMTQSTLAADLPKSVDKAEQKTVALAMTQFKENQEPEEMLSTDLLKTIDSAQQKTLALAMKQLLENQKPEELLTTNPTQIVDPAQPKIVTPAVIQLVDNQQPEALLKNEINKLSLDTKPLAVEKPPEKLKEIINKSVQIQKEIPTQVISHPVQEEKSTPLIQDLSLSLSTQETTVQQKPTELFAQLSQFIQAQTQHHIENTVKALPSSGTEIENAPQSQLNAMKETLHHQIHVELSPISVDALNKEAYHAKLRIYPPDLGEITAKLSINKNKAELSLLATNDQVKAIIESNLTQLREHFDKSNIELAHIDVQTSQSSFSKEQGQQQQRQLNETQQEKLATDSTMPSSIDIKKSKDTLVDTYA